MPHRSTLVYRDIKENDQEKYERIRAEGRKRDKARHDELKRKREAGKLSQDELDTLERRKLQ